MVSSFQPTAVFRWGPPRTATSNSLLVVLRDYRRGRMLPESEQAYKHKHQDDCYLSGLLIGCMSAWNFKRNCSAHNCPEPPGLAVRQVLLVGFSCTAWLKYFGSSLPSASPGVSRTPFSDQKKWIPSEQNKSKEKKTELKLTGNHTSHHHRCNP